MFRNLVLLLLLTIPIDSLSQVNLEQGLVAYYPFNGNPNDVSGNGNHGTLMHGVQLTTDRFGNPNSAYLFDGLDDYISVANSSSLNPANGLSIAVYFNPAKSGTQSLVGKIALTGGVATQYQVAFDYDPEPGVLFGVNPLSNGCAGVPTNAAYTNTGRSFPLNQWYCVVGTFDNGVMKIYLNGVLIETVNAGFTMLNQCANATLQIGKWWNDDSQQFQGKIDDIRIYNRALNQDEVNALCTQQVMASFSTPDTVCVNTPVTITNLSQGATSHFWNFCVASVSGQQPQAVNLGNPGNSLVIPVFTDIIEENGNYYVFIANYSPGGLVRLDFGNSLLNIPTPVNYGNFGGIIPIQCEGIRVIKDNGNWYAIMAGGNPTAGTPSRMVRVAFGPNIENPTPTATNWGNIGGLYHPMEWHIFKEGNEWFGFTVNSENSTITRVSFGTSFENTPTGQNLGNIGSLNHPGGIYVINDKGVWRAFVTNAASNTITRLDFGNSLANIPTGINLGNPGNALRDPRDINVLNECGRSIAFVLNGQPNAGVLEINFNDNFSSTPTAINYGNLGNMNFPHSISDFFRVGNDLYAFVPNAANNTLTRLLFEGCADANIGSSNLENPGAITYSNPGVYNISLTIDDGLPSQTSVCKQVVVLPSLTHYPPQYITICQGESVKVGTSVIPKVGSFAWNTGAQSDSITITQAGTYWVETSRYGCVNRDSFIVTFQPKPVLDLGSDTTLCTLSSLTLDAGNNGSSYLWNTGEQSQTIVVTQPGSYSVTVNNGNCGTSDTILIDFTTLRDFTISPQMTMCAGDTVQLLAGGGDIYAWQQVQSLSAANINNPHAFPLATTTYTVTIRDTVCLRQDVLQTVVSVNAKPVVNLGEDKEFCEGGGITLDAGNPGAGYSWSTGVATQTIDVSQSGQYMVEVFQNNCSAKDTVNINVLPVRPFTLTPSASLCYKDTLRLIAGGGDIYTWEPHSSIRFITPNVIDVTPVASTAYFVTIRDTLCDRTTQLSTVITLNALPDVKAISSNDIDCSVGSSQLHVQGGRFYEWYPVATLSNPLISNPIASPETSTIYFVKGIDDNGCSSADSVLVQVKDINRSNYLVPNAFSPNNDGINDCFGIKYWGVVKYFDFSIYNRWGERLFYTKNPNSCWDGMYRGKRQDNGVYIYVISASTTCDNNVFRKGTFTLIQ